MLWYDFKLNDGKSDGLRGGFLELAWNSELLLLWTFHFLGRPVWCLSDVLVWYPMLDGDECGAVGHPTLPSWV